MKQKPDSNTKQGHSTNMLLAVSGLPELYKIRNHFVTTLPTGEVTAWNMICWAKDFTRYMDEIIHEAEKAACASGAVDTVAEGEDTVGCTKCVERFNYLTELWKHLDECGAAPAKGQP